MALVGRMPSLKTIKFHRDSMTYFAVDGFRYLNKGLAYLQENGGSIEHILFDRVFQNSQSEEYLFQSFKTMPNLKILKITNCNMSLKEAQVVGRILSDFNHIQEVDLTNSSLNQDKSKEIADGLMRAKQLQILRVRNNPQMGKGGDSILYNLAFSPKIAFIDFTMNPLEKAESAEAIYKLVKISGSLETLILDDTKVNSQLTTDFFMALGENKTLKYISMGQNQAMLASKLGLLGKAIGMNKRKNGSLKFLGLRGCINGYDALRQMLGACYISDKDHEEWYGDKKIAKDMNKEQLVRHYEWGLEYLDLKDCSAGNATFNLKEYQKLK